HVARVGAVAAAVGGEAAVERAVELHPAGAHPLILAAAADRLVGLAPMPAMHVRAARAGRGRVAAQQAVVEHVAGEGVLAAARDARAAGAAGVDEQRGAGGALAVIEEPAEAPRRGGVAAPVVRLAPRAAVDHADD